MTTIDQSGRMKFLLYLISSILLWVTCASNDVAHADTLEECLPYAEYTKLQDQVLNYYDEEKGFPSAKHAVMYALFYPKHNEACSSLSWFMGSNATPADLYYSLTAMRLFDCKHFPIPMNGLSTIQKNLNNSDPEIAFYAIGAHWRVYTTSKKENAEWTEVVRNLRRIVQEGDAETMEKLTYAYATMSIASMMLEQRLQHYYNNFDNEVMSLLQDLEKTKLTKTQIVSMGNLMYHLAMLSKLKSFFYPATKAMVERQTYKIFKALVDASDVSEAAPLVSFLMVFDETEFMICDDPETKLAKGDYSHIFVTEVKSISDEASQDVTDTTGSSKVCTDPTVCTEARDGDQDSSDTGDKDSEPSSNKTKKKGKKGKKKKGRINPEATTADSNEGSNDHAKPETDSVQPASDNVVRGQSEDTTSYEDVQALGHNNTVGETEKSVYNSEEASKNFKDQEVGMPDSPAVEPERIAGDSKAAYTSAEHEFNDAAVNLSKVTEHVSSPDITSDDTIAEKNEKVKTTVETKIDNNAVTTNIKEIEVKIKVFDIYAYASTSEQTAIRVYSLHEAEDVSPVPAVVNSLKFVVQLWDNKSTNALRPEKASVQAILKETSYKVPLENPNYATVLLHPDDEGNLIATLKFKNNPTIKPVNGLYNFKLIISKDIAQYSFESPTASLWLSFRASTPISIFKRFDGTMSAIIENFKHLYPMEPILHVFGTSLEAPAPLALAFIFAATVIALFSAMMYIWIYILEINAKLFDLMSLPFLFLLFLQVGVVLAYFKGLKLPGAIVISTPLVTIIAALAMRVLSNRKKSSQELKLKETKSQ